jgi:glycine oxidase
MNGLSIIFAVRRRTREHDLYNDQVKLWDAIIVGAGVIGLSLAREMHKRSLRVLVIERGEPGREASYAAGGMLANLGGESPAALQAFMDASAALYPEFAHEIEDESGVSIDLRAQGTIVLSGENGKHVNKVADTTVPSDLEPCLAHLANRAQYLSERSVDPRALVKALAKAVKHRGVDLVSGSPVTSIQCEQHRVTGVTTDKTSYWAPVVVNCAGAWSGDISPQTLPTRPVKGQMLSLVAPSRDFLQHVVRTPEVYLIPRSDGRILVGATVEEKGFDKRTDAATIHALHRAAGRVIPELDGARMLEAWAGLRPGTPDDLPILGATSIAGYFISTGHYRDGILLAPATSAAISQLVTGARLEYDISAFSAERFPAKQ